MEIGTIVEIAFGDHFVECPVIWVDPLPTGDLTVELPDGCVAEVNEADVKIIEA